jgi:YfiH family protein
MVPLAPAGAGGPGIIPFAFPGLPGVACAFTTRRGGASLPPYDACNLSFDVGDEPARVAENRRELADALGISRLSELKQVHGDVLHFEPAATPLDVASALEGDAQATSEPGLALAIKTADCQPVLLAHESGRFVAALHVGWRGNVIGLPGSAVARLCSHYACAPRELLAVRGPSLGPARAEFTNFAVEFGEDFMPFFDRRAETVDLWRLTRHQLQAAGLEPARIFGIDRCTHSEADAFFSYRRKRPCGRMMALVWRT